LKKQAVEALRELRKTEIALCKRSGGKEQRRKGVEDRNKTVEFLFFWNCYFDVTRNRKNKAIKILRSCDFGVNLSHPVLFVLF
jgi:hypothetical protein